MTMAEKAAETSDRSDPQDASAFYFLGALLVQSQRYVEGLSYLEKAPNHDAGFLGHVLSTWERRAFQQHDTAQPYACLGKR